MQDIAAIVLKPQNLVFLAAAIQAIALLLQEQVRIRLILFLGSMIYLLYYSVVASDPLWEAITATLAMSVANLLGLAALLLGRSARLIPAEQLDLFSMLGGVQPGEFRAIMRHGHVFELSNDSVLTRVGVIPDSLYFVIDGQIEVEQGQGTFQLPSRHFVGEVSLMLGTPASATVTAAAGGRLVQWPRKELARAMADQPKMKKAIESLLGKDMARKVAASAGRIDKRYAHEDPSMEALFV